MDPPSIKGRIPASIESDAASATYAPACEANGGRIPQRISQVAVEGEAV